VAVTRDLASRLDSAGFSYCHWKSNVAIARSESGENDLDLLFHEHDADRLHAVLREQGFIRTIRRGAEVPWTENFYAFAPDGRRWVHLHVHYRLVLGHDRTKNHRLPIEDVYLTTSERRDSFLPTPPPELEYLVLVIRMVLKYAIADEIMWAGLRGRKSAPKTSEQVELDDLRARIDRPTVDRWLESIGSIDASLFADCETAIDPGQPLRRRIATAGRLERALGPSARRGRVADAGGRIVGRVEHAARARLGRLPGNRRAAGGVVVAVIGGDGSGKSTVLAEAEHSLRDAFEVRSIHMGKPPWSSTTTITRAAMAAAARTVRKVNSHVGSVPLRRLGTAIDTYRPLVWFALTARDRRLLHAEARRFAAVGGIVLSDRYPHPLLVEMDVPQIRRITAGCLDNAVVRRLARIEEAEHGRIQPPDELIVLRLDPDVAAVRKQNEPAESVRRRGQEVWTADWSGSAAHVVDASRSPAEVAADVMAIIVEALR
jgi:thymidylate kinase